MADEQQDLYVDCITKQLEEVNLLSSIYCTPGEMNIYDPGVISDFNEFLQKPTIDPGIALKAHLDFAIKLTLQNGIAKDELDVRIELPHLYPLLENAIVIVHSSLLTRSKEQYIKAEIERFIDGLEKNECYIFEVLCWLKDKIDDIIKMKASEFEADESEPANPEEQVVNFERLWIYSHHIKSKVKRQEIVKHSRNLDLSGFSRPGKPGIICVEGLQEHTQELWRILKAMHWQKINICKSEVSQVTLNKLNKKRRFEGFHEQLYGSDDDNKDAVMSMGLFIKFLEHHKSAYMKKELFGFD